MSVVDEARDRSDPPTDDSFRCLRGQERIHLERLAADHSPGVVQELAGNSLPLVLVSARDESQKARNPRERVDVQFLAFR